MNKPTESTLEVWAIGHKILYAIARYAASLLVNIPPENSQNLHSGFCMSHAMRNEV